ncbi:MAG: translocation/assembly module TamB domain-containing protein [Myxococcota bacterium]
MTGEGVDERTEPTVPVSKKRRWSGCLGKVGCAAAVALVGLGVGVGAAGFWVLSGSGQAWVQGQVRTLVAGAMQEGTFELGSLSYGLDGQVVLRDVVVRDVDGRAVAALDEAVAQVNLWALLGGEVHVTSLDATGLNGDLLIGDDGQLDIVRLFSAPADPDAAPFEGLPVDLRFDAIRVRESAVALTGLPEPITVEGLEVDAGFLARGLRFELTDLGVRGRFIDPKDGPLSIAGLLTWDGAGMEQANLKVQALNQRVAVSGSAPDLAGDSPELDLNLVVDQLDLDDLDAFTGSALAGQFAGALTAKGPLGALALDGGLKGVGDTVGGLTVDAVVNTAEPAWDGVVATEGLRIDQLLDAMVDPFPVTTTVAVQGSGSGWPDELEMRGDLQDTSLEIVGIQLDKVAATVGLDNGIIRLSDIDAQGPAGHLTGTAAVDLVKSTVTVDAHGESLDPRHLRSVFVPAELDGTRGSADAHVVVAYGEPDVTVDVTGTLNAYPLLWTPDIRADRARASYSVRVRGTDVDVDTDVTTWGLNTYGYVSDEASSKGVRVRVRESGVTGEGDLTLGPGRYVFMPAGLVGDLGPGVELGSAAGAWTMSQGASEDSPLLVNAGLDLGGHRLLRYPGQRGRVDIAMVDDVVGITARLDASASRRLADVQGNLNLSTLAFDFDQLQVAPEPGQTWTAAPGAAFVVDGLGVTGLKMDLRSARGHLGLSGDVGLEGAQDLHVDVYDLDLLAIAELLPMWADGLHGYVGGVVDVDGTAASPVLSAEIEGADLSYDVTTDGNVDTVVTGLGVRLSASGSDGRFQTKGRVGIDGTPLADFDLDLPFDLAFDTMHMQLDESVAATLTLLDGDLRRFAEAAGWNLPTGSTKGVVFALSNTVSAPTLSLRGEAVVDVPGLREAVSVGGSIDREAGDVLTWNLRAKQGTKEIASTVGSGSTRMDEAIRWGLEGGREPDFADPGFWIGELDAEARLTRLPIGTAIDLAGVPVDAAGDLGGVIEVRGTAMRPTLKGRFNLLNARAGTVRFEQTSLVLQSAPGGYDIGFNADLIDPTLRRAEGGLGSLFMAGHVPLEPDFNKDMADWVTGEMQVRIDADVPLALLSAYDDGVRQARGTVEVDGMLQGNPLDPRPHLDIRVDDNARFAYRPLGVMFSQLEADITFDQEAVTVARLAAMTSPASATGQLFDVFGAAVETVDGGLRGGQKKKGGGPKRADGRGQLLASGTAHLEEWVVDKLDLQLTLDRTLFLRKGDQYLRMSTIKPLTVTGDVLLPVVEGGVRVDGANIFVDYDKVAGGGAMTLDPRITVVRPGIDTAVAKAQNSVFDNVSIDIVADLGNSTTGRVLMPIESAQAFGSALTAAFRVDVQARMSGDNLRFRQLPCQKRGEAGRFVEIFADRQQCGLFNPEMTGVIEIGDGSAKVFQSDFVLSDSTVSFVGNEIYNPNLDLRGKMDAEGLEIVMTIGGTAYAPEPEFSSTDTDQELLAVITGRDPDKLASSSASHLLNVVATAALGSALSGVNLPLISVDSRGQVQVGLAVTRRLFVEATLGGTPRPDENVVDVELEYSVLRGLLFRVGTGAYAVPFWADVLFERGFD